MYEVNDRLSMQGIVWVVLEIQPDGRYIIAPILDGRTDEGEWILISEDRLTNRGAKKV